MKLRVYSRHSGQRRASARLPGRLIVPLCLILTSALSGCSDRTGASTTEREAARPSMAQARTSSGLEGVACFGVATADGVVHLLLGKPGKDEGREMTFYYTRSSDGGQSWSRSVRVPSGHASPGNRLKRGRDPQIAAQGDRVMALWTAHGDGIYGSGPLATAISKDGGQSWQAGPAPQVEPAASQPEPGYRFPALAAGSKAFHAVWIHAVGEERSLRYARLGFESRRWSVPAVIDPTSCACCWNELKIAPDGTLIALYRDEQPRDMGLAVSEDHGRSWSREGHAGAFGWQFNGCPHVGGGLALDSDAMWSTVWTGQQEQMGAYVLRTTNRGKSWSALRSLSVHGGQGKHTDIASLSSTRAAAVWDQFTGENGRSVFIARTSDSGESWRDAEQLSPPDLSASYPRVVACGSAYLALWTERAKGTGSPRLRIRAVEGSHTPNSNGTRAVRR